MPIWQTFPAKNPGPCSKRCPAAVKLPSCTGTTIKTNLIWTPPDIYAPFEKAPPECYWLAPNPMAEI